MAVRLTLLVAPLLGVTLVLLALLPPSSHVASSAAPTTSPDVPRLLSCKGEVVQRNTRGASGCVTTKGNAVEEAHISKRAAIDGQEESKRAPSGFFGMRGKKDDDRTEDKRAPSGFFGVRGKKLPMASPWYPRDPKSMGFFGMRGKKDDDKRGPSMGFFGSRGKKDDLELKRAVQHMGFFGMRGKKADEDDYDEMLMESKRAPMGFFGMRGKKDWSEGGAPVGLYEMRDEKADGIEETKRGLAGATVAQAWPRAPYSLDSLLAYLAGRDPSNVDVMGSGWRPVRKRFRGSKKAPMGFIGMRGKKDSLNKEVWPPSQAVDDEDVNSAVLQSDDELQNQPDGANDPAVRSSGVPMY